MTALPAIAGQGGVGRRRERGVQLALPGREDQQPRHRDAEVGLRALDQPHVAELAVVAQVGEVVLGPPGALDDAGVRQQRPRLAELVEPDVGEREVLLELAARG